MAVSGCPSLGDAGILSICWDDVEDLQELVLSGSFEGRCCGWRGDKMVIVKNVVCRCRIKSIVV